jgi:hypothetical protein
LKAQTTVFYSPRSNSKSCPDGNLGRHASSVTERSSSFPHNLDPQLPDDVSKLFGGFLIRNPPVEF